MKFQEYQTTRITIHNGLYKNYKEGRLICPLPKWHITEAEIDFSLQSNQLDDALFQGGFTILPKVSIDTLLSKTLSQDAKMFTEDKLYDSTFSDLGISDIINFWKNDERLIPPTVVIFDQEYMDRLNLVCPTSRELRIIDGKHRLKVACYAKEKEIPIVVFNWQRERIAKLLNL